MAGYPERGGARTRPLLAIAWILAAIFVSNAAAAAGADTWEKATLRIGLAADQLAGVSVSIGDGGIVVTLPAGASLPPDLVGATSGMLRAGRLTRLDDGGLSVDMTLAGGFLEGVSYDDDGVILSFRRRKSSNPERDSASAPELTYRLGIDDKIVIAVAGHPDLSQQVVVGGSGMVTAPLVGEVMASGLTVTELVARVSELLARDYLVDPHVDIQVVEYRSQWVVIGGEVRNPVRVAIRGAIDLKEALAEAGGFGPEAGEEIEISRKAPEGTLTTIRVDRAAFERGEDNPQLANGDLVNVGRAAYTFVSGEVRLPGKYRIERGMTLLRTLSLAGGLTEWANRKAVQIRREGQDGPGEEFSLKDIEAGKTPDPEIRGGDIVNVRRRFL